MKLMTFFAAATLLASTLSFASRDDDCAPHPREQWVSATEAKTKIEAQGYTITSLRVSDGCYEIRGSNKDNQRVKVSFDPKTLEMVEFEHKNFFD
ncbi:PepSY domain-containing protein [uncultured Deefgea sp.]|uniref:PepSY domain-containing protein n=1 Tax=uncultured Deefgea sp. TaxID=1304914 RepID=UPI00261604E5|nr:PepSY domain-containing protein [uncultured Deefgea sp.]